MKVIFSSLSLFCFLLCGCSTLTNQVTTGRDFDDAKVSQIKKGVSKADDVVALYGEPDRKEIVSGTDVMWHYTYLTKVTKTHSGMFAPVVVTETGYRKNLDVLLQNDVVINYTYVKVPIESQTQTSGGMISSQ
jgi:outer membrane protein assembly factor BamE (lipoprotein component of BamABCDE complex)